MAKKVEETTNVEETQGFGLNLNSEVKVADSAPLVPSETPQIVNFSSKFEEDYTIQKEDSPRFGEKQPRLTWTFTNKSGERQSSFMFMPLNMEVPEKFNGGKGIYDQAKFDRWKTQFAYLYKAIVGKDLETTVFKTAKSVGDVFAIAHNLLVGNDVEKPLYDKKDFWFVITYYNNRLNLPLTRFIEAVRTKEGGGLKPPLIDVPAGAQLTKIYNSNKGKGNATPGKPSSASVDEDFDVDDDLPM